MSRTSCLSFLRMLHHPKYRKPLISFLSPSCQPTRSLIQLHRRPLIRTIHAWSFIRQPTGLQRKWVGQLNKGPKIEIVESRLAARSCSYFSFFFSFSVFPFTLFLPRFLSFFFSFSPLFLFFPSLLPFLPTDRKFADGDKLLGGVTPLTTPARYAPGWY